MNRDRLMAGGGSGGLGNSGSGPSSPFPLDRSMSILYPDLAQQIRDKVCVIFVTVLFMAYQSTIGEITR
jgi:hypothetical protein